MFPHSEYAHLVSERKAYAIDEIDLSNAVEIQITTANDFILSLQDSVLMGENGFLSNYQVFKFFVKKSHDYRISVISQGRHYVMEKYFFIPQIILFDQSDNRIYLEKDPDNPSALKTDMTFYRNSWLFNDPQSEAYTLIVYSDNSHLEEQIHDGIIPGYEGSAPIVSPIEMKSTLIGKFRIRIEQLN